VKKAPGGIREVAAVVADALNRMRRNAEAGNCGSQMVTVYMKTAAPTTRRGSRNDSQNMGRNGVLANPDASLPVKTFNDAQTAQLDSANLGTERSGSWRDGTTAPQPAAQTDGLEDRYFSDAAQAQFAATAQLQRQAQAAINANASDAQ
jgi:hypothetical protein